MEELITVVIPVYNVEKYIHECIDSVMNQTYKNLEIILVDDGSTDNCSKICDAYAEKDTRIKVVHKENGGVSSARNRGIEEANGKYVAFIDGDDWIENEYFEIMMQQMNNQGVDVVICGYNRVSKSNIEKINASGENEMYNSKDYLIRTLNPQTGMGFCHMKLIKRECIQDVRFDEDLVVSEDAIFNMQISKNIEKAVLYKRALYNYRNNSDSVVKRYDANYAKKYLYAMKRIKEYIFENFQDEEIKQNYYNFVAYHVMLVAVNYCYHYDNNEKNKRKILKEVCNNIEFKEGIEKSNYKNISLTRKITLFTLKHKLYLLTSIICKYRQNQNRKGKR